ncbi:MAG: arabinose isomerase, partial [Anaerolineaceae bacterium]|nr:arabinose isomerase [Anaerolineaceae bacterium]
MNGQETAPIKVGLFGIGLDTYWPQFKGLKERLVGYQALIHQRLEAPGVAVINAGLVDSGEEARGAARLFASENVDIIFLY